MAKKNKMKVCLGMPLYNNSGYLVEALDSILGQSYSDFAIVAIDDQSTDETDSIMQDYAARDDRINYHRNQEWEGLISNWRKTFVYADTLHKPKYFAWISDHDRWDKDWLRKHVCFLEAHDDAAAVYPETVPINEEGDIIEDITFEPFDTYDLNFGEHLFRVCNSQTGSGNAIYGLFRSKLIKRAGIFRNVLLPDRLLLTEVSAFGKLKQLPEKLWRRRFFNGLKPNIVTKEEQRSYIFGPNPVPLHSLCPYLSHIISLILSFCIFPANREYKNFFRGLEMAGLLWERARKVIASELDEISKYLDAEQIRSRSHPKVESLQKKTLSPVIPNKIDAILTICNSLLPDEKHSPDFGSRIIDLLLLAFTVQKDANMSQLKSDLTAARKDLSEYTVKYHTEIENKKELKRKIWSERVSSDTDKQLIATLQSEISNLKVRLQSEKEVKKRLKEQKIDWIKQVDVAKADLEAVKEKVESIADINKEKSSMVKSLQRELNNCKIKLHEQKIIKNKLKEQLKGKNEKEKELRSAFMQACQYNEADHLNLNRLVDELKLIKDNIRELNKPHTYDDIGDD